MCYVFVPVNFKKAVRPRCGPGKHIVVGGFDAIDWIITPGRGFSIDIPGPDTAGSLDVRVKTYCVKGRGQLCPFLEAPKEEVSARGWVVGREYVGRMPAYLREFAVLRACRLVLEHLLSGREGPSCIEIQARKELEGLHPGDRNNLK